MPTIRVVQKPKTVRDSQSYTSTKLKEKGSLVVKKTLDYNALTLKAQKQLAF